MPNHIKPTAEELEAKALADAAEAEALAAEQKAKEEADAKAAVGEDEKDKGKSPEELEAEEAARAKAEEEKAKADEELYKKKAIEQGRENIVIQSKNKKLNEAIDAASAIADPTDEEMKAAFPDFEDMTNTERMLAKDSLVNKKRFSLIASAAQEGKDLQKWMDTVDAFVDDPKTLVDNPDLEGKVAEFKIFASKPTRRGVDFGDLIGAFLHDVTKSVVPKKKQMFEAGSGGTNEKPVAKTDKLTFEQGSALMKSDYGKYRELLKAGKIEQFSG